MKRQYGAQTITGFGLKIANQGWVVVDGAQLGWGKSRKGNAILAIKRTSLRMPGKRRGVLGVRTKQHWNWSWITLGRQEGSQTSRSIWWGHDVPLGNHSGAKLSSCLERMDLYNQDLLYCLGNYLEEGNRNKLAHTRLCRTPSGSR